MLSDGRILYHRWEYVDKSAGNAKALWSMNPDGSGLSEVYGNTISYPATMIQTRAIPDERNKIVMLGASTKELVHAHWLMPRALLHVTPAFAGMMVFRLHDSRSSRAVFEIRTEYRQNQ